MEAFGVTKVFQTWKDTELSSQESRKVGSVEASEFYEMIFIELEDWLSSKLIKVDIFHLLFIFSQKFSDISKISKEFYFANDKLQFQETERGSLGFSERTIYLPWNTMDSAVPYAGAPVHFAESPKECFSPPFRSAGAVPPGMSLYYGDMLNLSHSKAWEVPSSSLKSMCLFLAFLYFYGLS